MRKMVCLAVVLQVMIGFIAGMPSCYAGGKLELDWDYLKPFTSNRDIDTTSLHMLEKISQSGNKSFFRGLTITRPQGTIDFEQKIRDTSAVGIGPVYMMRMEKALSGKLAATLDMSGGFILYNKTFPDGGRHYNFMWRVGPQFIYKINETSSINLGYMVMHVSNGGLGGHNPSYNAHGVSAGFTAKF